MDHKSKIILEIFFALLVAAAFLTYFRTMVARDFPIENSTEQTTSNAE